MQVKFIIPRHGYGTLRKPGAGRVGDVRLSAEGMAALERLNTCSRGAVLDLAVRLLDVVVYEDLWRRESVVNELAKLPEDNTQVRWLADGLRNVSLALFNYLDEP